MGGLVGRLDAAVITGIAIAIPGTLCWALEPSPWPLVVAGGVVSVAALAQTARDTLRGPAWLLALGALSSATFLIAHAALPDALVDSTHGYRHGYICMSGLMFGGLAAVLVGALEPSLSRALRGCARAGFLFCALATTSVLVAGSYVATRAPVGAPGVVARFDALEPDRIVPAFLEDLFPDGEQRVLVDPTSTTVVARSCTGAEPRDCTVRMRSALRPTPEVGRYAPAFGRGELGVRALGRAWLVAPLDAGGGPRWRDAVAFERVSLDPTGVSARDIPGPSGAPPAWSWSALAGVCLAGISAVLALLALRRRGALASCVEALADDDGIIHLPDGTLARAMRALAAGPVLVRGIERDLPTYRDDGIARVHDALPGTRASHAEVLALRATALSIVAILITLIALTPVLVAESRGLVVAVPWAS